MNPRVGDAPSPGREPAREAEREVAVKMSRHAEAALGERWP